VEIAHQRLLALLRKELAFLERGGYRTSIGGWRPPLFFEDSPTCMRQPKLSQPCLSCALLPLVPPAHHSNDAPCRHIPLDEGGITLSNLYACGTADEIENALRHWLQTTIRALASEPGPEQ